MNKLEQIKNAKVNQRISFPNHPRLLSVRFTANDYGNDEGIEYSWSADSKDWGYIFPMLTTNLTKTFKTLDGAKRNFIKRYADYLESVKDIQVPRLDEIEAKRLENKREVFSVKIREIELLCREAAEITGESDMTADYIWGNCTMDELMKVLE